MPLVRKGSVPPSAKASLQSPVASERRAAVRALNSEADVATLGAMLDSESDASVREAILTSLCLIGTPQSVAVILPGVRSDNATVRRAALDALISVPQAVQPHLPALLGDPDPDVRLLSCEIVRKLPSAQATRLLADLLMRETVVNVCSMAIDVLAEIGAAEALPALDAVASRFPDEPFLQFAIGATRDRLSARE